MDRTTRTHYTNPTQQEIDDEVLDLMHRLGMYLDSNTARRDELTERIVDALPYRIVRRIERSWDEAQA
jgi:hypothetical protein